MLQIMYVKSYNEGTLISILMKVYYKIITLYFNCKLAKLHILQIKSRNMKKTDLQQLTSRSVMN